MDPTANLEEQREITARMLDEESEHIDTGDAVRLAELVQALDEWIIGHGFLPQEWADSRQYDRPEGTPCENCGAT